MVRKLIWTNIFFQQTALKALELQNKADEKSYKKSGSQLNDMFFEEEEEEDSAEQANGTESSASEVSSPSSPFLKPKRSSIKNIPVDDSLMDFEAASPVPAESEPSPTPAASEPQKKTVHWAEGADILDLRIMPKQYDPFTKSLCFYSADEIKKFQFEKVRANR